MAAVGHLAAEPAEKSCSAADLEAALIAAAVMHPAELRTASLVVATAGVRTAAALMPVVVLVGGLEMPAAETATRIEMVLAADKGRYVL